MMVASRISSEAYSARRLTSSVEVLEVVLLYRGASNFWTAVRLWSGISLRMARTGLMLLRRQKHGVVKVHEVSMF